MSVKAEAVASLTQLGDWHLSLGGTASVGNDNYEAYEGYIGSRIWFY